MWFTYLTVKQGNFLAACSSLKLAYIFLEMLKIGVCLLI